MSRGLGAVIRSGVRRRRVQTVVLVLVAAAAVTASVLGAGLLVASRAPFDRAFTTQRGAHLTVQSAATADQLAATADLPGVTAAGGPYPLVSVVFTESSSGPGPGPGPMRMPPMTVVGRADPGGDVDRVTLLEGAWATGPGEIVINPGQMRFPLGTVLTADEMPGSPTVTVVGIARSVSQTATAWTTPAGVAALGEPAGFQMLYRFAPAATAADLTRARETVTAAVPAVSSAQSWLDVRRRAVEEAALFVPFLGAFAILGLVMSTLVVGTVVAGAVGAAVRRIGVLKALGCTPAQVVRAYAGQAVIPAVAGTLIGVVAGNLLALPLLAEADEVYGVAGATIEWWVNLLVAVAVLALVAATAALTALRAGRLRTVDALAVGRATRSSRGRAAARMIARLRLPRAIGLGLARPFARPARTVALLLAIASGTAAATFAVGLGNSLVRIQASTDQDTADIEVGSTPDADADPAAVLALIAAQAGTGAAYAVTQLPVTATGLSEVAEGVVTTGDSRWDGIELVDGRWYAGAGEAVVSGRFLADTGTAIGDTVSLRADTTPVRVTIVGELFSTGPAVHLSSATLTVANPVQYRVGLTAGTDAAAYRDKLAAVLPAGLQAEVNTVDVDEILLVVQSLTATLALLLAGVAALGVLNTVVLDLRDRVHDLGVYRALGMTPRQAVTMVLSSIVAIGLLGGLLGVPAGIALQRTVIPAMGRIAGIGIPEAFLDVYGWPLLTALLLGGLAMAVAGALMPAGWAARVRVATALRTE